MLIHGKLILTSHGFMLDEVKSLLQKALRRKNKSFVTQSAMELLEYDKDQLQWKSIFTYLFEDHCLVDVKTLQIINDCFINKDKKKAIEVIYRCYTCRVAACLPVVALDDKYLPDFLQQCEIPSEEKSLIAAKPDCLNADLIFAHLKSSWIEKNINRMITCLKLCSIIHDTEKRGLTSKGESYVECLGKQKKYNIGHVVMTLLYKCSEDLYWKQYLRVCHNLLGIPDSCVRLALFAVVTHLMYFDEIKALKSDENETIDWKTKDVLSEMPSWAVDKHTFRGKFGKGTKHLLKNTHPKLSEKNEEEFHDDRPKTDITHFFETGCVCNKQAIAQNPFWEQTKEKYYSMDRKLQKTVKMTDEYYKDLKKKFKQLFIKLSRKNNDGTECQSKLKLVEKRKHAGNDISEPKTKEMKMADADKLGNTKQQALNKTDANIGKKNKTTVSWESLISDEKYSIVGPLLQLPTGGAKVYASLSMETEEVWKGPYPEKRFNLAVFFHKVMSDLFQDKHTLKIKERKPYIIFPLYKTETTQYTISKRDFYDCISKQNIVNGQFLERETLGILQLHKLSDSQMKNLPYTVWLHFIYRYLLNIGDSGIYNAITDTHAQIVYGIDMEEVRQSVKGTDFLNLMFTKLPSRVNCKLITEVVKENKAKIKEDLMKIDDSVIKKLKLLSCKYNVSSDYADKCAIRVKSAVKAVELI